MANLTPADIVLIPFIPYALVFKPSPKLNDSLQKFQFYILLLIYYVIFTAGCIIMIPMAYLKSLGTKLHILSSRSFSNKDLLKNALNLIFYIILGIPILCLNFFADSAYFWAFNVSNNVQSNEVFTDNS